MLISSLLWGICSSLDSGLLATAVEVSKSCHNLTIKLLIQNPPISFQDFKLAMHTSVFNFQRLQTALSWNDTQTDKTTTVCLWGSTHQGIMRPWKLQAQCLHRLVTIQMWSNLAYVQIVHMPIVLLCLLITESFYGAQIAGLHCIATKLEGSNYPMCSNVMHLVALVCVQYSSIYM